LYNRERYQKNRVKQINQAVAWKRANRDRVHIMNKRYYEKHREYFKKYTSKRQKEKKLTVFLHYTAGDIKCACCGEKTFDFLCVDHVNNDGNEHRKTRGTGLGFYAWIIRNNFPGGLQILCMNCNWGKVRNGGMCPHKSVNNL